MTDMDLISRLRVTEANGQHLPLHDLRHEAAAEIECQKLKLEAASALLEPLRDCDPAVRAWFGEAQFSSETSDEHR